MESPDLERFESRRSTVHAPRGVVATSQPLAASAGLATLQNRGASFSLDPDHPNRLEPGKRPFHTLVPAVARFGPDDWAGLGVMGGYMQPQGHVQVISNLVDYDVPLQAALDRPRWRYRKSGALALEERIGGAQVVRNRAGTLSAATEPRKDGAALGY
jgi:gamma-glutamyltranspeptidase/glutathione hydrolase